MTSAPLRLTKLELAFTLCLAKSHGLYFSLVIRLWFAGFPPHGLGEKALFGAVFIWLGVTAIAGIVGAIALIARGRILMVVPYLLGGLYAPLLVVLATSPYANIQTVPQLFAAEFGIYLGFYVFWIVLPKIPLPNLWPMISRFLNWYLTPPR